MCDPNGLPFSCSCESHTVYVLFMQYNARSPRPVCLNLIWRTPSSIVYSNAGARDASWGHKVQAELSGARGGAERLLCVLC
eukprot:COSAG02_NODE_356_length_23978_cov_7.868504_2_plen_81_part_00